MPGYKDYKRQPEIVDTLPEQGVWLPISIAAKMSGYTGMAVRWLFLKKKVRGIKFQEGPLLVELNEVMKWASKKPGKRK